MSVVIAVPEEVAQSLLHDDLAVRLLKSRAEPIVIAATIEVIGTAANLVTIAVAGAQLRESLKRTVRWALRRAEPNSSAESISITIKFPSGVTASVSGDPTTERFDTVIQEIMRHADGITSEK